MVKEVLKEKTYSLQRILYKNIKKSLIFILCVSVLLLGGCRVLKIEEAEREQMEFTLIQPEDVPESIKSLIDKRKMREFQFTYKSGDELYLFKGYGQQMTGGYSIQVVDLSESENAIFFETALIGPEKEDIGSEPSYPYIGVKLAYIDKPIQFR